MPKLYIANCTPQVHMFAYWIADGPGRHLIQPIEPGAQIQVGGKQLSTPQIDSIIAQHAPYGLVSVAEAFKRGVRGRFDGMAYSIDQEVPLVKLYEMVELRKGVLGVQGERMRTMAAIATNEYIEGEMQARAIPGRQTATDVSIEEMTRDVNDTSPEISAGVSVRRDAQPGAPQASRAPVRRRTIQRR
jgi:hypothetical protein